MVAELVTGAARRRREPRLRQFLRHERLSVAMALAESTHHAAPRGQKMARAGGVEREENYEPRLLDPPLPQTAATVGYVAAAGPLLVVPSLAGGDSVDGTAVWFLLKQTLALKKEDEEERRKVAAQQQEEKHEERMLALNRRVRDDLLTAAEHAAWRQWMASAPPPRRLLRRKRKKKRRRKLPKTSSFRSSRCVRIRRRGQGFRSRSSLSGAQCSVWSSTGLRCSASWRVCTRRTAPRSSSNLAVACAKLVFLVILHVVLFFSSSCRLAPCRQARR